jgi:hypothetical protein
MSYRECVKRYPLLEYMGRPAAENPERQDSILGSGLSTIGVQIPVTVSRITPFGGTNIEVP